ncbi:MAG TPA: hypothetical protein VI670_17510 [Thermoanaerobaculia bacterium]|jgi:hypothetical protein
MFRTLRLRAGAWRTVESLWGQSATAFFRAPAGGEVRVYYGLDTLGAERQTQTLDGEHYVKVEVGNGSLAYARIQVRVPRDATMTYDIYPGTVAVRAPAVAF